MTVLLVTGPRNCGKSGVAEQRVKAMPGPVVYIGTLPYLGEHVERIRRHRLSRPDWPVVELTGHLQYDQTQLKEISDATVLLDGLATYVHRCLPPDPTPEEQAQLPGILLAAVRALVQRNRNVVLVSTEAEDLPSDTAGAVGAVLEGIGRLADEWIRIAPRPLVRE